jgi:bifunctional N-acetylglucosamine-1-phosphate-uridyltransferase/glucosamine-1-phosphate-acetyltransferase GlmU-like protein
MRVFVVVEIDDKYRTINRGIYSTKERADQAITALQANNKSGYYYIEEDEVQA